MRFEVETERVRGHGRPRTTRYGRVYTDPKDLNARKEIADAFTAAGGVRIPRPIPVMVSVEVHRRCPKSCNPGPDVHKPDPDNVAKTVLDALNGLAWDDDAQVTELHVVKMPRERMESEWLAITVERA